MDRKLSREEQKAFLKEHRSTLKTVEGQNGGPDNEEGHEFQDPKSLLKAVDAKKEPAEGEAKTKDFKAGLRKVSNNRKASMEGKMKQQQVGKAMNFIRLSY